MREQLHLRQGVRGPLSPSHKSRRCLGDPDELPRSRRLPCTSEQSNSLRRGLVPKLFVYAS